MAVYEAAISTTIKVKHLRGWWINKFLNKMSSYYTDQRENQMFDGLSLWSHLLSSLTEEILHVEH